MPWMRSRRRGTALSQGLLMDVSPLFGPLFQAVRSLLCPLLFRCYPAVIQEQRDASEALVSAWKNVWMLEIFGRKYF